MKIGLYFGSFNPIHVGHLIIASYCIQNTDLQQVWLVVSPQNPLKPSSSLLNEYDRLHLVQLAIEDYPSLKASNIEFQLPKPSYTIDTLSYLSEKFPQHDFTVIMGSDSYGNLKNWKNAPLIVERYSILVYQRPNHQITSVDSQQVSIIDAPLLDISSTYIRQQIQQGKSVAFLVPEKVKEELEKNNYYKSSPSKNNTK